MEEVCYKITPSKCDVDILYDYLINNLSFNKIIALMKLLNQKMSEVNEIIEIGQMKEDD